MEKATKELQFKITMFFAILVYINDATRSISCRYGRKEKMVQNMCKHPFSKTKIFVRDMPNNSYLTRFIRNIRFYFKYLS